MLNKWTDEWTEGLFWDLSSTEAEKNEDMNFKYFTELIRKNGSFHFLSRGNTYNDFDPKVTGCLVARLSP